MRTKFAKPANTILAQLFGGLVSTVDQVLVSLVALLLESFTPRRLVSCQSVCGELIETVHAAFAEGTESAGDALDHVFLHAIGI